MASESVDLSTWAWNMRSAELKAATPKSCTILQFFGGGRLLPLFRKCKLFSSKTSEKNRISCRQVQ